MYIYKYANNYTSPEAPIPYFAGLLCYWRMLHVLLNGGKKAKKGNYTGETWVEDSFLIGECLESVGCRFFIEGVENIKNLGKPCIFVSNHMSTLETFLLPSIIQPIMETTYVIKDSLTKFPYFGPVIAARDPIAITRKNPREDFVTVMEEGVKKLAEGRSIIIFPQGSRSQTVDKENFNSLGIKLAKKAHVPIIPVAIKTDAWGTGRLIKEIGKIRPTWPIHVKFGEPVEITGNGKEEHTKVVDFIYDNFHTFLLEQKAIDAAKVVGTAK